MPRAKRTAAVAAVAKFSGLSDPGYASDDDGFEAYLDHDESGYKYPCRVRAEQDGYYTAIFLKQDSNGKWIPDGDSTAGVYFDPAKGSGHGIWRRLDRSVETESEKPRRSKKKKIAKESGPTLHDDFDTLKAEGKLPTATQLRKALKERNLPTAGSHRVLLARLHNYSE